MGWASATTIVIDVWTKVRGYIPDNKKAEILADVIRIFEQEDWDCQGELEGMFPESHEALRLTDNLYEE